MTHACFEARITRESGGIILILTLSKVDSNEVKFMVLKKNWSLGAFPRIPTPLPWGAHKALERLALFRL